MENPAAEHRDEYNPERADVPALDPVSLKDLVKSVSAAKDMTFQDSIVEAAIDQKIFQTACIVKIQLSLQLRIEEHL